MKKERCLLLIMLIAGPSWLATFAQTSPQTETSMCRIVDLVAKHAGEVDYVDGVRVPGDAVIIDYLREREKSSPTSCFRLFVTSSVKIQDIEDVRVIATGKMQYKDFHVYLYDPGSDSFREVLYGSESTVDKLRSTPRGKVAWPDRRP